MDLSLDDENDDFGETPYHGQLIVDDGHFDVRTVEREPRLNRFGIQLLVDIGVEHLNATFDRATREQRYFIAMHLARRIAFV